jgi:3-isopropylmalate/(R)-2-methylmalate dehydratase large subunit
MGSTITEKILERACGQKGVKAGDEVMVNPDFVHVYDFPGYTDLIEKQLKEEFGIRKISEPERFAVFIDHMVPAKTTKEEELHETTRQWCREQGMTLFERWGIGHQVAVEKGYGIPGAFLVHFDGHISQLGAFGTLAIGLRRNVLEAFVRDSVSLRVPHTVRVSLTGQIPEGIMARDIFHYVLYSLGPSFCRFQVLEFSGPALEQISIEGRQTMCCLAMFTGAITAMISPDRLALEATTDQGRRPDISPVFSDEDAEYAADYEIDLTKIEPLVAAPSNPANIKRLKDFEGLDVSVGYIGSCASGRLEDLRSAARVLKKRGVKRGFQLNVVPTSREIMVQASKEGIIEKLLEAGAFISSPTCDYCFGHIATMAAGQRAVSTGTLNVPGRMGSPDSEIYLCSEASVAAASIEGCISDPRRLLND